MNDKKDFAVIRLNSKQYVIKKGSQFKVDRISEGSPVDVLLVSVDGELEIGEPVVNGVGVKLEVVEDKKDKKISVRRFKSKSRYRRNRGHRQPISILRVLEIGRSVKSGVAGRISSQSQSVEVSDEKASLEVKPAESVSIDNLDITSKMKEALMGAGYKTVNDIKNASKEDLLKIKGFGEKSVGKLLKSL